MSPKKKLARVSECPCQLATPVAIYCPHVITMNLITVGPEIGVCPSKTHVRTRPDLIFGMKDKAFDLHEFVDAGDGLIVRPSCLTVFCRYQPTTVTNGKGIVCNEYTECFTVNHERTHGWNGDSEISLPLAAHTHFLAE